MSTANLTAIGDFDADSRFTNADMQGLLSLLASGGGSVTAVPEPGTLSLLAVAAGLGDFPAAKFTSTSVKPLRQIFLTQFLLTASKSLTCYGGSKYSYFREMRLVRGIGFSRKRCNRRWERGSASFVRGRNRFRKKQARAIGVRALGVLFGDPN